MQLLKLINDFIMDLFTKKNNMNPHEKRIRELKERYETLYERFKYANPLQMVLLVKLAKDLIKEVEDLKDELKGTPEEVIVEELYSNISELIVM